MSSLEAVRGVTLEVFAEIAQAVAARVDDHAQGTELAAERGIQPADWLVACTTWNSRVAADPVTRERLTALCVQRTQCLQNTLRVQNTADVAMPGQRSTRPRRTSTWLIDDAVWARI